MNEKTIVLLKYNLQNMQRELRTIIVMIIAKNLILTNCFADALRIAQDQLDSKNFYAINPSFDKGMKR